MCASVMFVQQLSKAGAVAVVLSTKLCHGRYGHSHCSAVFGVETAMPAW